MNGNERKRMLIGLAWMGWVLAPAWGMDPLPDDIDWTGDADPPMLLGGDLTVYDVSPCGGDGNVDVGDILGMLDAFAGTYGCNCPGGGGSGWGLTGNAGTNPATNFSGTTDNVAFNIRVNNQRVMRYEPNATAPNVLGGFSGNTITLGVIGATIAGGGRTDNGAGAPDNNRVTDSYGTIGGGWGNQAGDDAGAISDHTFATVGGGYNNTASGSESFVGGGDTNTASGTDSVIGGGTVNTASEFYSTVGGGLANTASGIGSTIGGGDTNTVDGDNSIVGGGFLNRVSGPVSTIGGGRYNDIIVASACTIAGGERNVISAGACVGGFDDGDPCALDSECSSGFCIYFTGATAASATIGGGSFNIARGAASTVPGGWGNMAGGDYSFAAGRFALVRSNRETADIDGDEGTFIWSDSTAANFVSTAPDQFLIRAGGGVGVNTNSPNGPLHVQSTLNINSGTNYDGRIAPLVVGDGDGTGGALLIDGNQIEQASGVDIIVNFNSAALLRLNEGGGDVAIRRGSASHVIHVGSNNTNGNGAHLTDAGAWTNGSSREWKENFKALDKQGVLRKLVDLPVTQWQYAGEDRSIHIGPVAEEFRAAFGLGHDDQYITTIDADGVALAAIQGLHQIVQEKDCEIAELREREMTKDQRIENLEARLARIEAILHNQGSSNGEGQ
jgi:hypothetical protein